MSIRELMCKVGLHNWKAGRRIKGFLVRKCRDCPARQEEDFPGGQWKTVTPKKRVRAPRLHPQSRVEEGQQDQARGLEA